MHVPTNNILLQSIYILLFVYKIELSEKFPLQRAGYPSSLLDDGEG
jgi:hypothetical protein